MSEFIVALAAVEIVAGENDAIVVDEAGVLTTVTIDPGTYYIRGDADPDDLLEAVKNALDTAGLNSYAVELVNGSSAPSLCRDPSLPSGTVRVSRAAGATAFRVRWTHANTTFPRAFLGFAVEKGAPDGNAELSTLSPSAVWVANDRHIDLLPDMAGPRPEVELASGGLEAVDRGDPAHTRRLLLELVDGRRLWPHRNTSDPTATWGRFWQMVRDGRRVELHELDLQASSSTLLEAPTTLTRVESDDVTHWLLAGESAERVGAQRVRSGMDHWDVEVLFHGYVAA